MTKMIFVNLPVTDLDRAKAFYSAIGFVNEPRFTDETAAAMQWSETIVVMLLTHAKWKTFSDRPIGTGEVALCVSMEDRGAVDTITDTAAAAGGTADPNARQEYGFMYGRSFLDPDGHLWEPMWMDPAMAETGPPADGAEAHARVA